MIYIALSAVIKNAQNGQHEDVTRMKRVTNKVRSNFLQTVKGTMSFFVLIILNEFSCVALEITMIPNSKHALNFTVFLFCSILPNLKGH